MPFKHEAVIKDYGKQLLEQRRHKVVSLKCSGVAYYKAISPAGMGKAPHRSLAERDKEHVRRQWKKHYKIQESLWKQVNLIEMLNVDFQLHRICH